MSKAISSFLEKWEEMSPNTKQKLYLAALVLGILGVSWIVIIIFNAAPSTSKHRPRVKLESNLLIGKDTKSLSQEAMVNQMKSMQAELEALKSGKVLPGADKNLPGTPAYAKNPTAPANQEGQQQQVPSIPPAVQMPQFGMEPNVQKDRMGNLPPYLSAPSGNQMEGGQPREEAMNFSGNMPLELPGVVPPPKRKRNRDDPTLNVDPSFKQPRGELVSSPKGSDTNLEQPDSQIDIAPPAKPEKPAEDIEIKIYKEDDKKASNSGAWRDSSKPMDGRAAGREQAVHLPAGSIISGTLLTGGDFATNNQAKKDPFPTLLRVKHEAWLPNRYKMDIRECFLIASGYGDLGSERAYMRAETLSCVRNDGAVIETGINAFASGPDGKAGIPGRLVSKTGQLIAKSMLAGMLSGIGTAFQPQKVTPLQTTPGSEPQMQTPSIDQVLGNASMSGMHSAMDKIATYYLDAAKNIFPTVEVNAGQPVDFILIKGTKLSVQFKPQQQRSDASSRR